MRAKYHADIIYQVTRNYFVFLREFYKFLVNFRIHPRLKAILFVCVAIYVQLFVTNIIN